MEDKEDEISIPKEGTFRIDTDWIRMSYSPLMEDYLSESEIAERQFIRHQYNSTVYGELMDTSLGGHITVNPQYSWGPTSDMHYKGRMHGSEIFSPSKERLGIGMGRYYSEAINKNSKVRTLILEAGIPEFKNPFSFIINAVDVTLAKIVTEGRTPFFYKVGRNVGTAVTMIAFPVLTGAALLGSYLVGRVIGLDDPKFYHFRADMPNFWSKANSILNTFLADARIISSINLTTKLFGGGGNTNRKAGETIEIDSYDKEMLNKALPHIFKNNKLTGTSGMVDISGVMGRFQAMVTSSIRAEEEAYSNGDLDAYVSKLEAGEDKGGLNSFMDSLVKTEAYMKVNPLKPKAEDLPTTSKDVNIKESDLLMPDESDGLKAKLPHDAETGWAKTFLNYYKAGVERGADVVALQVEYTGTSTDTFANTVKDIPLKGIMNSSSKKLSSIKYSMADGNIFGNVVNNLINAGEDALKGLIDGATLGLTNIASAMNGGGLVDFPSMWDDSSTQLATQTFKIRLNAPYNNAISNISDRYIPLSIILSLMLPRSIGRSAYGAPYVLKGFMQGVFNSDLCMMTGLSITRGGGNLGFDDNNAPTDLELTFSITELMPAVRSPTPNGLSGMFELSLDEYSGFNRYSKLLTGQSWAYSKYISKKAMLRLTKQYAMINSVTSPEYWARTASESVIGSIHTLFESPDISSLTQFSGK